MGVSAKPPSRTDTIERAIQYGLRNKAAQEALTEAEFKGLDVKVSTRYDVSKMSLLLRIVWHDPEGKSLARCIDHVMDETTATDLGLLARDMEFIVQNLSLRGELFFFRLAKHFPRHLKKVDCDGKGSLEVEFKNGQRIQAAETEVENAEFLAKCGMIYDL